MHILIAPDKFKGSLSAREVAENIALGLRDVLRGAKIDIVPMADGGEGTAEVICDVLGGSWLKCKAHDPLGRDIDARYAWIADRKLAVLEMSEAAGVRRLSKDERDPLRADTFGVGEMILNAAQHGAREMIVGLGGSATNDGGFGMARALGFRFGYEHEYEHEHERKVTCLLHLTKIAKPKDSVLPKIIAAVDVRNPLLGENGATRVFGPQKGAADDIGFGLMSFCGARIRPGFDVVAEAVRLESKMKDVDLVITGEGSLDRQTLEGKTPAGVARLARKLRKRVFAIVGRTDENRQLRELFDKVYELAEPGMSEKENIKRAAELLRERAQELAKAL